MVLKIGINIMVFNFKYSICELLSSLWVLFNFFGFIVIFFLNCCIIVVVIINGIIK